jgi:hypothetical protein
MEPLILGLPKSRTIYPHRRLMVSNIYRSPNAPPPNTTPTQAMDLFLQKLDRNKLLYDNQLGFQRGKSTEHNLIKAVNNIGESINSGKFCIVVFFDLKKAFDVVSHDIL